MPADRNDRNEARSIAAAVLQSSGRHTDAAIVWNGGGDDFDEVRAALQALLSASGWTKQLERALACYADPTFWNAGGSGAALAFYDKGEIARSALAGKELYQQHRD